MFLVYVVLCLIVFGCQYQCSRLPGKTRLRNDIICVEWDVKPYTLTHSGSCCVYGCCFSCMKEEIRDLLAKDQTKRLELKERPDTGVYVKVCVIFVLTL